MILTGEERVLFYGLAHPEACYWAERMRAYGTKIVAAVSEDPADAAHLGLPIAGTAQAALAVAPADLAVLFVPPLSVKDAAIDTLEAGIRRLVILTEHVPVQDVMYVLAVAADVGATVLGPNSAGCVTPGVSFVGVMPAFDARMFRPGQVGVVARSGSLGALVCRNLVQVGLGISAFIGIGGDPILGTTMRDALWLLDQDPRTAAVALVGEIGGGMEEEAAVLAATMTKPIAALIAGAAAPFNRRLGHAGAIITTTGGSHAAKEAALAGAGVALAATPAGIATALRDRQAR